MKLSKTMQCSGLLLIAAAPVLMLAPSDAALAADETVEEQPALEQVVVTATRRSTTVQTTPISITAVTADQLAARGITDSDSLVSSVPGIAVRNTGGPGEMELEVRGLNSQGGNSSMVGLYLGEIPLSTAAGSELGKNLMDVGLYDVQRVEVLRGPQGTLYGSSSMGGTIRVLPNAPQLNELSASTQEEVSGTASGGGFNHKENGMLNIPLGDTAALRIVGSFTDDSGWIKRLVLADGAVPVDPGTFPDVSRPGNFYSAPLQNTFNGVNGTKVDSVRAQLLWRPVENLTIEPMALYQLVRQGGPPAVDVNGSPTHPALPAVLAHYEIYDASEQQTDSLSFGSLKMEYQLPSFSVTSATGFWHRNFIDMQDTTEQLASAVGIPVYDASAGGLGPNYSYRVPGGLEQDYSRQLSEELRVTSTGSGPLQWVGGYFYQDLYSQTSFSSLAPQATPILGGPNLLVDAIPQDLIQNSVYGHVSWRFSPHFEVEGGVRHYHYSLNSSSTQYGAFSTSGAEGNDVPDKASTSIAASGTVPSFAATYNIDQDHLVYARVGKGFRLGGVSGLTGPIPVVAASNTNPLLASAVANECGLQAKILLTTTCNPNLLLKAPDTFKPDSLWSYELGEKSAFFNHRLLADVGVYLENWSNPQLATNLAGFGLTVNGGNARVKGIEGQMEALLPWGFDLSLNASYTNAQFIESSAISGYPAGMQIPDTPKVSGSVVLQWEHDLSGGLGLFGSLEEDYTGARTDLPFGVTATLNTIDQLLVHLPGYGLANFRFGLKGERAGGDRWAVALLVNNFTNRQVLLDPQPQVTLQTAAFERYVVNQPLTAGINVSYQFR
ncbi:MAG TPA: TonB-dependent receptor [Steroidobacteraceae bacterium]|nr:TonB-dependent receptor [Steroidobacteraceae bacterium]